MASQASAIHTHHVTSQIDKIVVALSDSKEDDYEAHLNHIKAAAKLMEEAGKTEEVKKLRAALVKLQGSILESTRAAIACKKLRATYAPGPTMTDFEAVLSKLRAEATQDDADLKKMQVHDMKGFDQEIWDINHPGEPMPGDDDDEEEIAVQGDGLELAKNAKCPVCSKDLLLLVEPVEDKMGIAYCKQCIEGYIQQKGKGKPVKCPQAGTSHDVGKQDLKPAKLIIRAQKRAAAAKSKAGAASGSQKRKHEVVIDEEDE